MIVTSQPHKKLKVINLGELVTAASTSNVASLNEILKARLNPNTSDSKRKPHLMDIVDKTEVGYSISQRPFVHRVSISKRLPTEKTYLVGKVIELPSSSMEFKSIACTSYA